MQCHQEFQDQKSIDNLTPEGSGLEGKSPKNSGKSRLVKYYNLVRSTHQREKQETLETHHLNKHRYEKLHPLSMIQQKPFNKNNIINSPPATKKMTSKRNFELLCWIPPPWFTVDKHINNLFILYEGPNT